MGMLKGIPSGVATSLMSGHEMEDIRGQGEGERRSRVQLYEGGESGEGRGQAVGCQGIAMGQ